MAVNYSTNGRIMMTKLDIAAYFMISAFVAAFLGIFAFYGSVFLWFKWIKKMESVLGARGTAIGTWKSDSDDYFTRQFRVQYIVIYFLFIKIPVVGKKWAARVGQEITPLSKCDRYIGFILSYTFWLSALYFGIVAFTLMKVAPL